MQLEGRRRGRARRKGRKEVDEGVYSLLLALFLKSSSTRDSIARAVAEKRRKGHSAEARGRMNGNWVEKDTPIQLGRKWPSSWRLVINIWSCFWFCLFLWCPVWPVCLLAPVKNDYRSPRTTQAVVNRLPSALVSIVYHVFELHVLSHRCIPSSCCCHHFYARGCCSMVWWPGTFFVCFFKCPLSQQLEGIPINVRWFILE